MSGDTSIEWTDATWNPTTGCDKVSPGCDHCYAMTLAPRLKGMGSKAYQLDGDPRTSGPGFLAHEWPSALDWPLHKKKKPLRIFVNSMSDLFHASISDEYIAEVFAVMALAPQHTFQILTKRHARMRSLLNDDELRALVTGAIVDRVVQLGADNGHLVDEPGDWWPLRNVWLGVSVEDQQWADIRISAVLATPATIRFLSCEPLLGPVDLRLSREAGKPDWVIAGGESGPGARPMHPDWARSLRDQCNAAGVPFLFKQWGEWRYAVEVDDFEAEQALRTSGRPDPFERTPCYTVAADGSYSNIEPPSAGNATMMRVGKKAAGRILDGRTWDQYPAVSG